MSTEKSNLGDAGQSPVSDITRKRVKLDDGTYVVIDIDNDKIIYDDPFEGCGATWQVHETKDKRIYYIVYWHPGDKNEVKVIFVESKKQVSEI